MKPLFTIHEGEFLVGDHINRKLGRKFDVWVPTKDTGVDLLVTRKSRNGKAVGLQVKFSRDWAVPQKLVPHVAATSWFVLNPRKIRDSNVDLWVFAILTLRHEPHFVVVPTSELRKRIPRGAKAAWNLYIWVYAKGSCFQVRGLSNQERLDAADRGIRDRNRDFSPWLENWTLLDRFTR